MLLTPRHYAALGPRLERLDVARLPGIATGARGDRRVRPSPRSRRRGAAATAPAGGGGAAVRRTVAVLEGLNDPENLGAIARSARALGVDALVLDPTCIDPYYRRTVRVSMGEVLHLPVARVEAWPDDLELVRGASFELWALTPDPAADDLFELAVPDRVAVLLGAEGPGLSAAALDAADRRVRIPIDRRVDSLNVGSAAAIAFAVLARHRR